MAKKYQSKIRWTDEQLAAAGIDKKKLQLLVRKLNDAANLMDEMDMQIYGAAGSGNLIHRSRPTHIDLPSGDHRADQGSVVAWVGEGFDGGDW